MELIFIGLASFIVIVGAILMFVGNRLMKKTVVEEVKYTVDNNKEITIEDANLNEVMIEVAKLEGGKVNLTIAQIKDVAKALNDYVGDDTVYDALRAGWLNRKLAER